MARLIADCRVVGRRNRWIILGAFVVSLLPGLQRAARAADDDCKIEVQVVTVSATGEVTPVVPVSQLPTSHQQTKTLAPSDGSAQMKLASFCATSDGHIVAVVARQDSNDLHGAVLTLSGAEVDGGTVKITGSNAPSDNAKPTDSLAEVRILDADGKLLNKFPLDFQAQAVNVCPNGNLLIGGSGILARYDLKGKELARSESPHVAAARKDPDQLKQQARELVEQQRHSMQDALQNLESQKEVLAKKDDKSLTAEERQMKGQLDSIIASYKQQAARRVDVPVSEHEVMNMVQSLSEQARKINAVASNGKYIFCTAPASKGYGYSVWRTGMDFSEPKRIVDGLSGCCGQMDIQCCGDDFVVAENSRKRVVRYDANGKEVSAWGKASRDGEADTFGSCCNPMNTRAVGDKLYVSDSDGRVRLFTLDGKYESEVGRAEVTPGCKSSIVDVSPDGNRVYYIDVNNSRICVLDRKPATEKATQ